MSYFRPESHLTYDFDTDLLYLVYPSSSNPLSLITPEGVSYFKFSRPKNFPYYSWTFLFTILGQKSGPIKISFGIKVSRLSFHHSRLLLVEVPPPSFRTSSPMTIPCKRPTPRLTQASRTTFPSPSPSCTSRDTLRVLLSPLTYEIFDLLTVPHKPESTGDSFHSFSDYRSPEQVKQALLLQGVCNK